MEKVSIITPTYNSSKYISEAVESVLAQSYAAWEMIIVDDCSSDKTYDIIQRYACRDNRIKVFRLPQNSGPAAARNLAMDKAQGRYIAFLDSDDLWVSDKLERQLEFMKEKGAAFTYTAYEKMDESGDTRGRIVHVPDQTDYKGLLSASVIGCLTVIYDTNVTGKVFMPNLPKRQDHGLWLKILKMGHIAYGLNEPLAYLRIREGSISSNKVMAATYVWKLYRDVEGLSFLESSYHFINYAARAFFKYRI